MSDKRHGRNKPAVPYKLRRQGAGIYSLGLPPEIARTLPPDARFWPELTEEGILYRLIRAGQEPPTPSWPTWIPDSAR